MPVPKILSFMRNITILLIVSFYSGCTSKISTDESLALSNDSFAETIATLSEPSAFFDSDNIISNEISYLHILDTMDKIGVHGGVYIGVGPDQNFTYLARIKPKYAFILDIRRDNLLEHLLFKAIMDLAGSPTEYLSILFSKPTLNTPPISDLTSIKDLVDYFDTIPGDEAYHLENIVKIQARIKSYKIDLYSNDLDKIDVLYNMFYKLHLDLQWEYKTDGARGISFIPYRTFLLGQDREGSYGNFLNNNDDYLYIKDLQARNLIIPVVGDFSGKKALKSIGEFVKKRGDYISAFYLSNVEYYLLPDGLMGAFANNVRQLPIEENSVLIRAYVNLRGKIHPKRLDHHLMTNVMQYIRVFNQNFAEGRYKTYYDLGVRDYMQ